MLCEDIKKGLIEGKKVGIVFFDFSDAFGSVNRYHLLHKLGKDFDLSGNLFLHIHSFLEDRYATLRINDTFGQWIESLTGTSARTLLGPLLFIAHVHDVPSSIKPKFADDLVAVVSGNDMSGITKELQLAIDHLDAWADREGMTLNVDKTVAMLFGDEPYARRQIGVKRLTDKTSHQP